MRTGRQKRQRKRPEKQNHNRTVYSGKAVFFQKRKRAAFLLDKFMRITGRREDLCAGSGMTEARLKEYQSNSVKAYGTEM